MIFTPAEIDELAEELGVSVTKLNRLISRSIAIAESYQGCDRPLGKRQVTVIKQLNYHLQNCYLENLPIDFNEPITVKARIGNSNEFHTGNAIALQSWVELDSSNYNLNPVNGELSLFIDLSGYSYGTENYSLKSGFTEVEVTYTGGFDFSDENNSEVQAIKAHFYSIVEYLNSGFFTGTGAIKKEDIDQEYSVEYYQSNSGGQKGAAIAQVPESLLLPFRKYRGNLYEF